ncbi:serpin family protein [Natrarchaeobius oligotrophus]|uniref:Serpin family protein n=1 Tax=Natrarchaeobius chitinivorans TaxID=1679083 RepID=A0A3N6PLV3_NATCH|nr:serpin family protein [Natrarchaeobius chitinivorans]RQG99995.1 serpin family protein [Natrarchaeobius chitinivorans]
MTITRRRALALLGAGVGGGGYLWHTRSVPAGDLGPETRPDVTDDHLEELVRGNAAFAAELLRRFADEEPNANHLFSPVSLATALAMARAGARGETATQLSETLAFPPEDDLHPAVGALLYDLNARAEDAAAPSLVDRIRGGREFDLTVATALWGQAGYPYREAFLETLESNYGAGLREVDFAGDADGARSSVNEWIADATGGRIDELLPAQSVTDDTRLVATNAVALLADWDEAFDPDDTRDRPFTALDGSSEEVPMMSQTDDFPYARIDGHQAIELPYVGGDVSMVVVLPAEGEFEALEADLGPDLLGTFFDALEEREVGIDLPRFEFDVEFGLADALGDLGMPDAFDPDDANFEGVAPTDHGSDALYLYDVHHEAYVSVDEEGTEAVAATGLSGGLASGPMTVTVDRPFLFVVRDRTTDAVLFLGRVVDAARAGS